ncbi:MAG: CaiB/BaiF CoA-transferase family protein [Pseudomonadota bacterium]
MPTALSHIRVLDLSRVLAGPWCSQMLADFGAEVIKIERPGAGDDTRGWGPPWLKDENGDDTSEAAYYLAANRGKKSVTLDISKPEGQAIVRRLAQESDILLENYKLGDLKRYGLSYEDLKAINPRLIYCSITGFGQTGPYSHRPGYDYIIQGMGGLMSITGERDDLPGGGPQKVGVAMADLTTGMYATIAVLTALAWRETSGEGQYIDLALLDTQVSLLANMNMNYLTSGVVPKRAGNAHANIVPYQVFATKDGHIIVAVGNEGQYAKFCQLMSRPDLAEDVRFKTNAARVTNRQILVPILEEILKQRSSQEWLTSLESIGVPSGPINNIGQVFEDPQIKHRKMKVEAPHPLGGTVPMVANPIKFSATPIDYAKAPPTLGQHTREVLREVLGMNPAEIETLIINKIV